MTSGFDEQDLARVLNAPATPAELSDEASYRAVFRAEGPTGVPLRAGGGRTAVRRVGTATTLAVTFAIAGAGVAAAAYSSQLPSPVQSAVHRVLAPIGVPPAEPQRGTEPSDGAEVAVPARTEAPAPAPETPTAAPGVQPTTRPAPEPTTSAAPTPEATPSGSGAPSESASDDPLPTETATSTPTPTSTQGPSQTPTPTPTPTPSAAPSPTPPPAPATVTVEAAVGHRVAPGQTTVISGVVAADDGAPVPGARVLLQERTRYGWRSVDRARSAEDGSVALSTPPAERTASYRLKVRDVRSAPWRLILQPALTASATTTGDRATVTAEASGGRAGDRVLLLLRRDGRPFVAASGRLGESGQVRFDLAAPSAQTWYAVRLLPNDAHAGVTTRVLVAPGAAPTVTPTPSPSP